MPAFLVSLTLPNGQRRVRVINHSKELFSEQEIRGLRAILGLEFGISPVLISGFDLLPDVSCHPCGKDGPYCYYVTYNYTVASGIGVGASVRLMTRPMLTLASVQETEEAIRLENFYQEVHLESCKPLREPNSDSLAKYHEALRASRP